MRGIEIKYTSDVNTVSDIIKERIDNFSLNIDVKKSGKIIDSKYGVCKVYELGFQTGTYDPRDIPEFYRETYKTKEFAIKECEVIAKNLKKFKENYIR